MPSPFSSFDVDLTDLPEAMEIPSDLARPPTARELHDTGLQIMAQGCLAQAEICFRAALHKARTDNAPGLASLIAVDLARSIHERNPSRALKLLVGLDQDSLTHSYRRLFLNILGCSYKALCRFEAANKLYRLLLDLAQEHNDLLGIACSHGNRALIHFTNGAYSDAHRLNKLALEASNEVEAPTYAGLVINNMATDAMHTGRYEEAAELFDQVLEQRERILNVKLFSHIYANRGELELLRGDSASACRFLDVGHKMSVAASLPTIMVQTIVLKSVAERRLPDDELLEAAAASAIDLRTRDISHEAGPLIIMAACLATAQGKTAERYLTILDPRFGDTPFAKVLWRHYEGLFAGLGTATSSIRGTTFDDPFPAFISHSAAVRRIKSDLQRLVDTDVKLLLQGESGTGKSFLARQIHQAQRKGAAPFVVVDCTNLEEHLFESKLFGHLRGSFTGAVSDRTGLVEQAHGGTLFLDEIGELPLEIQGKLLYVIEEQRFRPVGAKTERYADIRVVAATNRDVDQMLNEGRMRRDLFFRMAGFRITLPPLRDRREDIVPLAEHRLDQLNSKYRRKKALRASAWDDIVQYAWPGNVRELNTTLERGYHLSNGRRIQTEDLGIGISEDAEADDLSWYAIRRQHLLRVLSLCRGNVTRASEMLGLNRTTLIYKLKLLRISRDDYAKGTARFSATRGADSA